ncbi:MAG TPA: exodeoxyribonuclease III [Alphaproteobacteria bacterium]|nr:exodeoxyribonuclease III [Alphaproteobacteria bacterium]|tara:strand:+ start:328 stop:1098 length:771 start_codon:yes stop_codon:yes gene_type:complete
MRIASWNVNSAKARQDHILDYLKAGSADVLLIQETKTQDVNFPVDLYQDAGWNVVFHGQKSYNGVAIAARQPLTDVMSGLPGDAEDEQARYMEATIDGVRVATIYLPNGNPAPGPKFDYKLAWMERLNRRAEELLRDEIPVVLAGDFNVIPQDIDCYDPPGWEGDALTRAESRAAFNRLSLLGYTDALRACHPGQVLYSYWDYQAGAWQKDNGVRIDHLMLSPEAADRLVAAEVDKGPRGLEKPSDHTPVWVDLRD